MQEEWHLGHSKGCSLLLDPEVLAGGKGRQERQRRPGKVRGPGGYRWGALHSRLLKGGLPKPGNHFAHLPRTSCQGLPKRVAVGGLEVPVLTAGCWVLTYLMSRTWACSFLRACAHSSLLMKSKVCSGCRGENTVRRLSSTRGPVFFF